MMTNASATTDFPDGETASACEPRSDSTKITISPDGRAAASSTTDGDDKAASTIDANETEPKKLKFPNLKNRRVPHRYIPLHAALDQLGTKQDPARWGRLPLWEHLPFLHREKDGGFVRPHLTSRYRARLTFPRVNPKLSRSELRSCYDLYRRVCKTLRFALEDGEIEGYALASSGEITPIEQTGIWAEKHTRIFYMGLAPVTGEDKSIEHHRVILKKGAFKRWLDDRFAKGDSEADAEQAKSEQKSVVSDPPGSDDDHPMPFAQIADVINEIARKRDVINEIAQKRYVIKKIWIAPILKEVFASHSFKMLPSYFNNIWKGLEQTGRGRGKGEHKTVFDDDIPRIKSAVSGILASREWGLEKIKLDPT